MSGTVLGVWDRDLFNEIFSSISISLLSPIFLNENVILPHLALLVPLPTQSPPRKAMEYSN